MLSYLLIFHSNELNVYNYEEIAFVNKEVITKK
jgi:hypothetical protein